MTLEERKTHDGKYYKKRNKEEQNIIARKFRENYKKKHGYSYSTVNLFGEAVVDKVYEKFNYSCAICNSKKGLCIHHKDRVGNSNYKKLNKPVNNKLDNLLLVCRSCHMIIHDNLGTKK
jgi:hypothetical protein